MRAKYATFLLLVTMAPLSGRAQTATSVSRTAAATVITSNYETLASALVNKTLAQLKPGKATNDAVTSALVKWRQEALPSLKDSALFHASLKPVFAPLDIPVSIVSGPDSDVVALWHWRSNSNKRGQHLGFHVTPRGKRWFVTQVLTGGPAAALGLKRGDEVINIDGQSFHPRALFQDETTKKRLLSWRRRAGDAEQQATLSLRGRSWWDIAKDDGLHAENVAKLGDRNVGYSRLLAADDRLWSRRLAETARRMQERADIWILDLRGGYDGWAEGLAKPFFASEQGGKKTAAIYTRPLIVLVDQDTAGSREWLAAFLQSQKRAILLGLPTAGTMPVMQGQVIKDSQGNDWLLRLPQDSLTDDERRTAFSPLVPDKVVKDNPSYAEGMDFILEDARILAQTLEASPVSAK